MNDSCSGFGFKGHISYIHYDGEGNIKDIGSFDNIGVLDLFTEAIDALDTGTFDNPLVAMSVGIGIGQTATSTALNSFTTVVINTTGFDKSQPSVARLTCRGTFNGIAAATTIKEAGLFGNVNGQASMRFYNDGLSVLIGGTTDTLIITWNVDCKQCSTEAGVY